MKYIASIWEHEGNTFFREVQSAYEFTLLVLDVLEKMLFSQNEHKKPHGAYVLWDLTEFPHRVFLYSNSKIVSFSFNFNFVLTETDYLSISVEQYVLTLEIVSCAKMIVYQFINSQRDWINEQEDDMYQDYSPKTVDASQILVKHIICTEPSYIRYDYDPEHANGNLHPKHHIDINYSNKSSYKFGIVSRLHSTDINYLMDMLNKRTDCHMLQKT